MSNPDRVGIPFEHMHSVRKYADQRYGSSIQNRVNLREQRLLAALLAQYFGRGGLILDLPSGYGRLLPLYHSLDYRVYFADISPQMVAHVKSRPDFGRHDLAATADIREGLPLGDDSLDGVSCVRLFQHLHYPAWRRQALREFARVSKRYVMVSFYDRHCLHYWTKSLLGAVRRKPMRVQMISRQTFEADAAAAGLRVVEYRALIPKAHAQTFAMLEKI